METTVGQLLINAALPEDMRDYNRVLDKKGINRLLREVAQKYPDKYRDVSHKLNQVGWMSAQESGGFSFGLQHLTKSKAATALRYKLQDAVREALDDDNLTPQQRDERIIRAVGRAGEQQQKDVFDEALKAENPLAYQTQSGSRGNKMNLSSLLGSDLLYTDHHDQVIPIPVLRSYSEGLTPAEYWAGTYGARKGVMATKFATQEAGYLSKQLNQVAHRLVVVDNDRDGDPDDIVRGMPVDTDDEDNEGSLLAVDTGPYKRNTVLTPKIIRSLKRNGYDKLLIRSPIVGGSPDGGVYARDVGVREHGGLPGRGENVGLAAAQALSEPLSQAQLSAKHSGGVAGAEKSLSGFDYINQLIQVPKHFKGGAAHAEEDGLVGSISAAPAGGFNVMVNGKPHYVPEGVDVSVKPGDRVEAGDVISSGIPNPAQVVRHKGIGEGRRYFVSAYKKALGDAGIGGHRRNIELLARGLINHVRLTEEMGDKLPDDVVPYSTLENIYEPREGTRAVDPRQALGKYLERPILHYTIGSRVSPSMLKQLEQFKLASIDVHDNPPPFEPEMIRGAASLQYDPDWMTRMYGSGQKSSLLDATHHGAISDEAGTSFVPSLTRATQFGRMGATTKPEPVVPVALDDEPDDVNFKQADLFGGTGNVPGSPASPDFEDVVSGQKTKIQSIKSTATAQAKPAITPPAPPTPPPHRFYTAYRPGQSTVNTPMFPMLAQLGEQVGPLGTAAAVIGLDPKAFSTLTQGANATDATQRAMDSAPAPATPAQPSQPTTPAPAAVIQTQPQAPAAQAEAAPEMPPIDPSLPTDAGKINEANTMATQLGINPNVTQLPEGTDYYLEYFSRRYANGTMPLEEFEANMKALAEAVRLHLQP